VSEPAKMPANCGLFLRDRETAFRIGLRGGPGRTRTSNQTVMSQRFRQSSTIQMILRATTNTVCSRLMLPFHWRNIGRVVGRADT
jgi:hypothetical protein